MRAIRALAALLGLSALVVLVTACATTAPQPESMAVVVTNNAFSDANVYVQVDGSTVRRLGTVNGYSSRRFSLSGPAFYPGSRIALYAKTIAEGREYLSESFTVTAPGFQWTLESLGREGLLPLKESK